MAGLPQIDASALQGDEAFVSRGQFTGIHLIDYWRWAHSNVISNSQRGLLAEFIVAMALSQWQGKVRDEWGEYDLSLGSLRIEVKASGYIQTWGQPGPSEIRFDIAPHGERRASHLYVFCLHHHTNQSDIDPLNLDQWTFYVVPTQQIDDQRPHQKTIGLEPLLSVFRPQPLHFDQLANAIRAVKQSLAI